MFMFLWRRYASYFHLGFCLLAALGVKYMLANASLPDLRFLLWPPAQVVSFCFSSIPYWDPAHGYVFSDLEIYINKSCAAINFLTILFLSLSTLVIFYTKETTRLRGLVCVLLLSYPLCLLVNSLRIVLSVYMQDWTGSLSLALREGLHEFTGGVCFFGALLFVLLIAEKRIQKFSLQKTTAHKIS